ncbi:hypothetical protein ACFQ68_35435 [Amycolatopsis japonica]|uniref:hypothetical protein n=1 Tax=Amycolatopsis japonica TaxID=208439 RepID=UPI00366BDE15
MSRRDFRPVAEKRRRDQAAGCAPEAVRNAAGSALPENGDFDLQELQGRAGVDIPRAFPTEIGRELGKPVLMAPEGGSPDHAVLGFDPEHDRVVLLAAPL